MLFDMLPQKLSLDVVVEKDTRKLHIVEVNGLMSGYSGMGFAPDIAKKIYDRIGDALRDKLVLINPHNFLESQLYVLNVEIFADFLKNYGVKPVYTPPILEGMKVEYLERALGYSLGDFDAL